MARLFTRASKLTGIADIAPDRGDLLAHMRAVGIEADALRKSDISIDYAAFCALLHNCAVAWDMPDIGLRMAGLQGLDLLGPVALIVRMERTFRSAMNAICENLIIHSNAILAVLEETPGTDTATVVLDIRSDIPDSRENTELILAQANVVIDAIAEMDVPLVEVAFRHAKGASAPAVSKFFGCPVRYGAERNALSFDRDILDLAVQRSDHAFHTLIQRYLMTSKAEVASNFVDEARREVSRQMELGTCTLENVARGLKISTRSMQRQLRTNNTTFGDLVDEWRQDRALSLVLNTRLPLSEVSGALGYSEQSVFTKAFRRWYGIAPLRYRTDSDKLIAVR